MDLKKSLGAGIDKYAESALAQGGLTSAGGLLGILFPPVGVAANAAQTMVLARLTRIEKERVDQACADLHDQIDRLDKSKLDSDYVQSDAFFDWLREAFDRIRRAEDREKVDALRNTFLNGLLVGQSAGPFKEIVLRRLGEMSPHHVHAIRVWGQIARPLQPTDNLNTMALTARQGNAPFARREDYRAALDRLTEPEFDVLISDLMTMGVLANWYPEGTYGGMAPMERVGLTDLGTALINFMTDPTA